MEAPNYPIPPGLYAVPDDLLDLRSDAEIDSDLLNPKPVEGEKNIWFFWHSGYASMHPYAKRTVRAYHRRFSKQRWVIRVIDRVPSSPLDIANFVELTEENFPRAFIDRTLTGRYAAQHNSDLVRWPLLLKYGGLYADVGMMQIGDLDRLYSETVGNPDSPYEIISYSSGGDGARQLTNYFLCCRRNNPLFLRCHKLFLALWAEDGGKTSTEGMHASPLMRNLPLQNTAGNVTMEEDGKMYGPEDVAVLLTDYIIQGQVITQVMGLEDGEDGWNGPEYVAKHVYAIEFMEGSQLINVFTAWNGPRAFELMSLRLPGDGEEESEDQKLAGEIVKACLTRSWGFKLAHGLIIRVFGETLGSLWQKHEGSDEVPGTYGHWLRHAITYWNQENVPERVDFQVIPPFKKGPLLREA
jgi:hypothetical protein